MNTKVIAVRTKTKKADGSQLAQSKSKAGNRAVHHSGNEASLGKSSRKAPSTKTEKVRAIPTSPPGPTTTVQAKIDVGFGNTLFIRGEGGGISWEHGTPMRCVDASTWEWSNDQVQNMISFQVLFNDVWAVGEILTAAVGEKLRFAPVFQ